MGSISRESVFEHIESEKESLLAFWEELVNMESGSRDKENVDRVAARVASELESFGVETEIIPCKKAGRALSVS